MHFIEPVCRIIFLDPFVEKTKSIEIFLIPCNFVTILQNTYTPPETDIAPEKHRFFPNRFTCEGFLLLSKKGRMVVLDGLAGSFLFGLLTCLFMHLPDDCCFHWVYLPLFSLVSQTIVCWWFGRTTFHCLSFHFFHVSPSGVGVLGFARGVSSWMSWLHDFAICVFSFSFIDLPNYDFCWIIVVLHFLAKYVCTVAFCFLCLRPV